MSLIRLDNNTNKWRWHWETGKIPAYWLSLECLLRNPNYCLPQNLTIRHRLRNKWILNPGTASFAQVIISYERRHTFLICKMVRALPNTPVAFWYTMSLWVLLPHFYMEENCTKPPILSLFYLPFLNNFLLKQGNPFFAQPFIPPICKWVLMFLTRFFWVFNGRHS